ncbi:cytochrome c biogenesis protein ResB [Desulfonema magnum]|uniref:Cytochrome c biogenesis protein, CcsB-like n=1 Tax=Desulfonema magnum TaxID=45655 RepID=A0A975BF12_9BACT|nr:cytochrome c biogenesis protein ResB [Desulfonema magnum]QTA84322.1 Putative cytochrome c biogenesis protein, CcsB-like [Desulfonema magnum]
MEREDISSNYFEKLWKFFTSVRLTVVLLLSLAATSVIGTVIPQNESNSAYFQEYGEVLYRIFYGFGFFDMYHSWWFQAMLIILTVNIVVCSLDRLSATWKIIFSNPPKFNVSRFRKLSNKEEFTADYSPEQLKDSYKPVISKAFGYSRVEETDEGVCIFAEKGRWTRLGVYIVHISVILLLVGGLFGSIFGFEGFVNIPEGSATDHIRLRKTSQIKALDFTIQCDKFNVSFYDSGAPREYRSGLTILEGDKPVLTRDIIVNDPLRYKGINIFQSSYGTMPENADSMKGRAITLSFTSNATGMVYIKKAVFGKKTDLPENMGKFIIKDFDNDYNFRGHKIGKVFIGTVLPTEGEPLDIVIPPFSNFDRMRGGDFAVSVTAYEQHYYTGLQITKDPGVLIVYSGFIMMIIGFLITFFMSHRRVCVEMTAAGEKTTVMVAGMATKNKMGMEIRTKKLSQRLAGIHPSPY